MIQEKKGEYMNRWEWIKFLGIEPGRVGIEVMKREFPCEDVDTCMDNEVETPIEGLTDCPECGKKLRWIRFCSPDCTWKELCGRKGPLAICEDCHKQIYFWCEVMN